MIILPDRNRIMADTLSERVDPEKKAQSDSVLLRGHNSRLCSCNYFVTPSTAFFYNCITYAIAENRATLAHQYSQALLNCTHIYCPKLSK